MASRLRVAIVGMVMALLSARAEAAPGPGIGNQQCASSELNRAISMFDGSNGTPGDSPSKPYGHNVVIMAGGYLMLLFAPDSGHASGGLLFYDVSDPWHPRLVRTVRNADTALFRETHSLPVARVGGRIVLAVQTVRGVQLWDVSDAATAQRIGSLTLDGVSDGDYDDVAWQLAWQYPYLFVAGSGDGVHVVDAGDPTAPRLVTRVPTSRTGGFRIGPLFALGDYLVVGNMDQDGRYGLLDIGDPATPALIDTAASMPKLYSMAVFGDRIYGAGRENGLTIHRFGPGGIDEVGRATVEGDGLYLSYQDGFLHYGQTHGYKKVDVRDERAPRVVGDGHLADEHADHGQTTPFGNLVFIGNDHGSGSALFCHATAPDRTPPSVMTVYPADGATQQARTSRVSVAFSDNIDIRSVTAETLTVRPVGGDPLEGGYSYGFNTVSFGTRTPLAADTTYEIVLAAGGVRDAVGNPVSEVLISRFSTGDAIAEPPPDAGVDAATGADAAPDVDAGSTVDAATPAVDDGVAGGCGCDAGSGAGVGAMIALLALRRRRR